MHGLPRPPFYQAWSLICRNIAFMAASRSFCPAIWDAGKKHLFLCMSVGLGIELVGGFTGILQSLAPIRLGEVCYSSASADDAIALFTNTEHPQRVRSAIRTWNADLHVSHRSLLFLNKT